MENIKDTPLYNKYRDMASNKDLIIGSIANDRMSYVIDNFFIGNITDSALANDICKNYRREGMFFDEILDDAKSRGK